MELDPEVIMSNASLELIARKPPKTVDELRERDGIQGWRSQIIAEPIFNKLAEEKSSSKQ